MTIKNPRVYTSPRKFDPNNDYILTLSLASIACNHLCLTIWTLK